MQKTRLSASGITECQMGAAMTTCLGRGQQRVSWIPNTLTKHHSLEDPVPHLPTNVCHAELNAIMNKNSADVKGCTMYVALFPCNECAKLIIQAGIKEVIFMSDKYHDSDEMTAARLLFDMAGVAFSRFWFLFLSVWCTIIGSYRDKISSESREIFFLPTENEIHTKVQQDCH
ncbi:deoxycytidylate deaminase isoform X3 [Canis lupus baileyi]|uniref:deoxycytidylate deaminase isoform X3 n=1 Tax=Canis lupus baileyi TaxID=143281 RepID=UPI003B96E7E7